MTETAKPYNLTFDERPAYLYAHLTGDTISVEIIRDYIAEVVAKSNATGKRRIMLYRDIPAVLPESQTFFTVRDSLEALRGKKLALVNPHAGIQKELAFAVTVGLNRGGNYADFTNIDAAERWLLADSDA
jgi:hypothetical protein